MTKRGKGWGGYLWKGDQGNNGVRPRDEASNLNKINGHSGRCVLRGDLTRYDLDVTLLAIFYQSDASTREETEVGSRDVLPNSTIN